MCGEMMLQMMLPKPEPKLKSSFSKQILISPSDEDLYTELQKHALPDKH